MKGGIEACFSSVSCACALLGALDELSQGRGLQPEQVCLEISNVYEYLIFEFLWSVGNAVSLCRQTRLLIRRLDDLKEGPESARESMEINEADFRWQRQVLSSEQPPWDSNLCNVPGATEPSPDISISITTETGQTTLGLEVVGRAMGAGHTTPEEDVRLPSPSLCCDEEDEDVEPGHRAGQAKDGAAARNGRGRSGRGGVVVPPDVVQRSHAHVYPDITNFLSVESRARTHHHTGASRYSESNFRYKSVQMKVGVGVYVCLFHLLTCQVLFSAWRSRICRALSSIPAISTLWRQRKTPVGLMFPTSAPTMSLWLTRSSKRQGTARPSDHSARLHCH